MVLKGIFFCFFSILLMVSDLQGQLALEDLFEGETEYSDQSFDFDIIDRIIRYKININTAKFEDLLIVPGITPVTAIKIIRYRNRKGGFRSLNEIDSLLNNITIEQKVMKEIFMVPGKIKNNKIIFRMRQRLLEDIDKSKGFIESYYYPAPLKSYTRFSLKYGDRISFGFHCEKDPGEKEIFDHTVFFLKLEKIYNIDRVVIGNYYLNFALGLVFYRKRYFDLFTEPIYPLLSRSKGIIGYSSSNESDGFRGIALEKSKKNFNFYVFLSSNNFDANSVNENAVSGFYTSGYHRNKIELSKKNLVKENLNGFRIEYSIRNGIKLGITSGKYSYNKSFVILDSLRNKNDFSGDRNFIFSGDMNITLRDINIFIETAKSGKNGYGVIGTFLLDKRNLQLISLFRNYSPGFHSIHGNSYNSISMNNQNEVGFLSGFKIKFTNLLRLSVSCDQFRSLSRTYFYPMIKRGVKTLFRLNYGSVFDFLYSSKKGDLREAKNDSDGIPRQYNILKSRDKLRFEIKNEIFDNCFVKIRIEKLWERKNSYTYYTGENDIVDSGILLYIDLMVKKLKRYSFNLRQIHFKSRNNLVFYQFERDLPGLLSIRPLIGLGRKWYFLVSFKLFKFISLSSKYSEIVYYGVNSIGSGWNKVDGNKKRSISIQVDFDF